MPIVWLKNLSHYDLAFTHSIRNTNKNSFFNNEDIPRHIHEKWFERAIEYSANRDNPWEFFIIMSDDTRAGTISVDSNTGEIGNVALTIFFQGKGVGSQAIKIAINLIKSDNIKVKPFITVREDNTRAIDFYLGLGFVTTRRTMTYEPKG